MNKTLFSGIFAVALVAAGAAQGETGNTPSGGSLKAPEVEGTNPLWDVEPSKTMPLNQPISMLNESSLRAVVSNSGLNLSSFAGGGVGGGGALLQTGSISGIEVNGVQGVNSMAMNTGVNSNLVIDVSVNMVVNTSAQ